MIQIRSLQAMRALIGLAAAIFNMLLFWGVIVFQ